MTVSERYTKLRQLRANTSTRDLRQLQQSAIDLFSLVQRVGRQSIAALLAHALCAALASAASRLISTPGPRSIEIAGTA